MLAEAPVKMIVPRPSGARRRAAPTKAADPPELLKLLSAQLLEIDAPVVAGVEDDHIGRRAAIAGRHRPIKETNDIVLARCVDCDRFGAAACRANRFDDLRKLLGRSAGDQHMISLRAEAAAQRGTKPALGAHTHNDRSAAAFVRAHVNVPVAGHFNLMTPQCTASIASAMPWPPPMQSVTMPRLSPSRRIE
jgi:hypothetical protein